MVENSVRILSAMGLNLNTETPPKLRLSLLSVVGREVNALRIDQLAM